MNFEREVVVEGELSMPLPLGEEARYAIDYTVTEQPLQEALQKLTLALPLCEKTWKKLPLTKDEHERHLRRLRGFLLLARKDLEEADRRLLLAAGKIH